MLADSVLLFSPVLINAFVVGHPGSWLGGAGVAARVLVVVLVCFLLLLVCFYEGLLRRNRC